MNNLSVVLYTSQKYIPIAELFVKQFNKHSKELDIPKYIISNKFDEGKKLDFFGFQKLSHDIPFCEMGTHFRNVLKNSLERIDSEYILFFLDDYLLIRDIKISNLNKIMKVMVNEKIDHISLMSYDHPRWKNFDIDYEKYDLDPDFMVEINLDFLYLFSVQPCIWNKKSLIKLLEFNEKMSIHDFDTSRVRNIKGEIRNGLNGEYYDTPHDFWDYGFKHVALKKTNITKNYAFDEHDGSDDYFLFLYSEIVRHGKFNFFTHINNRNFLQTYLPENNITSESLRYQNFF